MRYSMFQLPVEVFDRKIIYSAQYIWERPFCAPRTVTNMAIRKDSLDRLKFASAHKAISSVTCISDHSLIFHLYSKTPTARD